MRVYKVKFKNELIEINAQWDKKFWNSVEAVEIDHAHPYSDFKPVGRVKMAYSDDALYLIFRVEDKYLTAAATEINGQVWKDSCVEFFFAPDAGKPESYFNIETNCCGVVLAQHHTGPRENTRFLDVEDCRKIKIAGPASGPILNEIAKPITWTLEYALPFDIIARYADFQKPGPRVVWHGNFYKCAEQCSHPHWLSWSSVSSEKPDFHRPDCFGRLEF